MFFDKKYRCQDPIIILSPPASSRWRDTDFRTFVYTNISIWGFDFGWLYLQEFLELVAHIHMRNALFHKLCCKQCLGTHFASQKGFMHPPTVHVVAPARNSRSTSIIYISRTHFVKTYNMASGKYGSR